MTPFIVWLSREEVTEVLSTLILTKPSKLIKEKVLNEDELLDFTQNLIEQNSKLISIIEKVEPLNPMNKKAAYVHGATQKCIHYNEELNKMRTHCSIYNKKLENKFLKFSEAICKDCSRKKDTSFSIN